MPSNNVRTTSSRRHGQGKPGVRMVIGGFCLSLAGAVAAVFANTDALIARGFSDAVAADALSARAAVAAARPAVSGSEEFWLDRAVNGAIKPASWQQAAPAAAVGQRFTLAANGSERTLEIVDVRAMPDGTNTTKSALLLVTCKDVNHADASPLRLVLEPGQSLPGLPQLHSL